MQQFQRVKAPNPQKSAFDLSHEVKLTLNMGDLVPILNQEVIPGDNFQINTETLMRFQPMLAPIMHRINTYVHYYFIPNRILWRDWEDFITAGVTGTETPAFPVFNVGNDDAGSVFKPGTLADYLGLPTQRIQDFQEQGITLPPISMLPFRAYTMIWNEYYREQNLQDEIDIPLTAGTIHGDPTADASEIIQLRKRNWEKDYFTSCLPWQQRGPEAHLPITGEVTMDGQTLKVKDQGNDPIGQNVDVRGYEGSLSAAQGVQGLLKADNWKGALDSISASINDVRRMFAIQRWFEKSARFGSRYEEIMFSHFGMTAKDSRVQKPEYIGGGKIPIQISEVLQQSSPQDLTDSPLGHMGGHGITAGYANMNYSVPEHGTIMAIMSVMPRTGYYQGIPKKFLKHNKFDYFWPDFAHLGEQEVKKMELYITEDNDYNNQTLGFQQRYQEYRTEPDRVHGELTTDLEFWHLARKFTGPPALNSNLITANPDSRIFAVQDPQYQKLIAQVYHKINAMRPIPKHGTPV